MHLTNRELFLNHQAQTTHFPLLLEIHGAEGCYLIGAEGKKYLDLISGIGVSSLGHGHPEIKAAIKHQVDQFMHLMVYGEYVISPQTKLAQKLISLLPKTLDSVYFVNSGTEATEGALKLAKAVTGRTEIVAFNKSYHGSTHGALSLNSEEYYKQTFRPLLPGIRFIDAYDFNGLNQITKETACVILETVRSENGYAMPDLNFLKALALRCKETGSLLILDEIQCGLGRTGSLFAFEQFSIQPDILLLGKALGAGLPMGAFISNKERMMRLADQPMLGHITTFGGNPVVCAGALAGLKILTESNIIQGVAEKSALFKKLLVHPLIQRVDGVGLMLSVEFEDFKQNKAIIDGCIEDGLIADWFLFATNKMRIAPPLTISEDEIKLACEVILANCHKIMTH